MNEIKLTTVPRELYYHEVAYVRKLESSHADLLEALQRLLDAPEWGEVPGDTEISIARALAYAALAKAIQP